MTDEVIIEKYQEINRLIDKAGKRLIAKLSKYGVNKNHESFTDLIHSINEIKSTETYYIDNIKPQEPELVSITYNNGTYTCNKSLIEYNDSLINQMVYYIKLLKYYLALKGVNLNQVNNTNTVAELIELIDFINRTSTSTLTIDNVINEYYFGDEIPIFYTLVDDDNKRITKGIIEVYDGDMFLTSVTAGSSIIIEPKVGEHNLRIIYKGTDKYAPAEKYFTLNVKPSKIVLDFIIANQTDSSAYYRSSNKGLSTDAWYFKIETKNNNGSILKNIPLTIKDILLDDNGNPISTRILRDAVTDNDGVYISQNINIDTYGKHKIEIETQYQFDDMSNRKEIHVLKIVYDLFYTENFYIKYYEDEVQNPIVIELHNEDGIKPYDETSQSYSFDGTEVLVTNTNILSETIVSNTNKIVNNGNIVLDIDLPVGYYHILLDAVVELSMTHADIRFKETDIDIDDDFDTHQYHVYGLIVVDIRENLKLIKRAVDDNGNIKLYIIKILSAINDNDTDFIKSLALSNEIIYGEKIIKNNNKTVEENLYEAIGKIYLNEDGNIEYGIVNDIYRLDNRKLQYNKQQG